MKRKIIRIDEEKCDGCGLCIPDCPEGALKVVDGKVKLVSESLCDGLGACIGKCPKGALAIEERDADDFDEVKARENMETHDHGHGCPGMMMMDFTKERGPAPAKEAGGRKESALRQWPVQLKLLNPDAPYFKGADLVVAADCVPFSYADFHGRFLEGKVLVIFCPKLDDSYEEYVDKLALIFKKNDIRTVTVARMEVPCCGGTAAIVEEAIKKSGKRLVIKDHTISIKGEII